MPLSSHILLANDFLTSFYAAEFLPGLVRDRRRLWDHEIAKDTNPPRARLGGLSSRYFKLLKDATDGVTDAHGTIVDATLDALGYPTGDWPPVRFHTDTSAWDMPVRSVVVDGTDTPVLIAIATRDFITDPTGLLTAGLADPGHNSDDPDSPIGDTKTVDKAISLIFAASNRPRFVMVCGGGTIALIDYHHWHDGKWLGADLEGLLGGNDSRPGQDLDQFAYLFGIDATSPDDETPLIDIAVDGSNRQAVGVSKELRGAVQSGVEAIANEVIYDLRFRQKKKVFNDNGEPAIDAADLARQAIRWMYRLVVLLYAEARPATGLLPVNDETYLLGYSLERLRELSLTELRTPEGFDGTHFHDSLNLLFDRVHSGHTTRGKDQALSDDGNGIGVEFAALNSRLFAKESCPDIHDARLRNRVLRKVIEDLSYAPGKDGKGRQTISYATLEVNQLGAVYEGLMAYTGFLARDTLHEVARGKNTWTVNAADAELFTPESFLTETDPATGRVSRVEHPRGRFLFRITGRDRTRSASYYTPSTLTRFTVAHALAEWSSAHPGATSADILNLTILEPALGSGAFANEAATQLAELYLRVRQEETEDAIPVEDLPVETRRVRAHFAVNQTYGVDLNDTAVELAEVSLWLNAMFDGLGAPPLTARLRRGNSLVGARRAMYSAAEARSAPWTGNKVTPARKSLRDVPFGSVDGIHQFLLPGEGWGVGSSGPAKDVDPEWAAATASWRRTIQRKPSPKQVARARSLADQVELAWEATVRDVKQYQSSTRRSIPVWRSPLAATTVDPRPGRHEDPTGPVARLRTVMDAWCALWMWGPEPIEGQVAPTLPCLDEWFDAVEYLIGSTGQHGDGTLFSAAETDATTDRFGHGTIADAQQKWPWLRATQAIAEERGFFHWDLEFGHVQQAGGFDLVLGNPPWAKLARTDTDVITDAHPVAAVEKWPKQQILDHVPNLSVGVRAQFGNEAAFSDGLGAFLGSATVYPLTYDCLTNLYITFIERVFDLTGGLSALIHQESFYEDVSAAPLTAEVYRRMRRHWHFVNELPKQMFEDVHNETEFGVHVLGSRREETKHLYAAGILLPHVVDESMAGKGSGTRLPGKKTTDGNWDIRPHPERILTVDDEALAAFHVLSDASAPPDAPRLLRLYARTELEFLEGFLTKQTNARTLQPRFSTGLHESSDAKKPDQTKPKAVMVKAPGVASALADSVIKGPNIHVANPFYQEANEGYSHSKDNRIIDATDIDGGFVPRTVLQAPDPGRAKQRMDTKNKWGASEHWRMAWPEHISRGWVRCFQPVLIPPGTMHGHSLNSAAFEDELVLARFHALCCSTIGEYLIRVMGTDHVGEVEIGALPAPPEAAPVLWREILARTLRLNCLNVEYAPLWERLYNPEWTSLTPRSSDPRVPSDWSGLTKEWTPDTPIRTDYARWHTLVEVDALATLILGADPEGVIRVGRQHLGLQDRYETNTVYDQAGRRLSGEFHNRGGRQTSTDQYHSAIGDEPDPDLLTGYVLPVTRHDRWAIFRHTIDALAKADT